MSKEFEKYLIFAGNYRISDYYLRNKNKKERKKYRYVYNSFAFKGLNKVGIILLYEWDQTETTAKYNWIITLLHSGSKIIEGEEYVSDINWNIFEKIQNPPIKYTKYNRWEIMDI